MSKPTLFYSNYCDYSKNLLTKILKNNIRELFIVICIDDKSVLPNIDRVPILIHENKSLSDEGLFNYIESVIDKRNKVTQESIQPFTMTEMGNTLSDQYSYIEGVENEKIDHNFVKIKDGELVNTTKIETPEEDENVKMSISYDEFISRRDQEIN